MQFVHFLQGQKSKKNTSSNQHAKNLFHERFFFLITQSGLLFRGEAKCFWARDDEMDFPHQEYKRMRNIFFEWIVLPVLREVKGPPRTPPLCHHAAAQAMLPSSTTLENYVPLIFHDFKVLYTLHYPPSCGDCQWRPPLFFSSSCGAFSQHSVCHCRTLLAVISRTSLLLSASSLS